MTLQELVDTEDFPVGAKRRSIEDRIEKLNGLLDIVDDDPDLEDNADGEARLGWPDARGTSQLAAPSLLGEPGALNDDRELDFADYESTAAGRGFRYSGPDESEDNGDLEPWLGGHGYHTDAGFQHDLELDDSASEPSLGWPEQIHQQRRLEVKPGWFCEDGEEECDDEGVIESGIADADATH